MIFPHDVLASFEGIGNIEKNISLNTGDTYNTSWTVINNDPSNPITVVFSAEHDGAKFVTPPQSLTIPGGERKTVTFAISIPNDASAGTYKVIAYAIPEADSGQNTAVRSIFYIIVSDGTSSADSKEQSSQTTTTPKGKTDTTTQTTTTAPKGETDTTTQTTTTAPKGKDDTQQTTTTPGGTSKSQTTTTTPKTPPKESPTATPSGSSTNTAGNSGSGNRGGGSSGGGGSISKNPVSTADTVYLKEVSWDCKAGIVTVIAGPDVDALSVTVRTSQGGVQQATLSEDKIPGFKKFTATMKQAEDYLGIKVISMSGRDSSIVDESIDVNSCAGSKQYQVPQKDVEARKDMATKEPPKDATPGGDTNTEKPPVPAPFVDVTKDPQFYIDRYNSEPEYKKWFHENYPEYDSIYEAVGVAEPSEKPVAELKYAKEPLPDVIKEPTCGDGTVLVDGICQATSDNTGGGCLIATAAFGGELAPQVQQLREIRDSQLLATPSGKSFMGMFNEIYYSFSPDIADYQRQNPAFNELVRIGITPMLSTLSVMENADDDASVISLGALVIALNGAIYAGLPALGTYLAAKGIRSVRMS